MTDAPSGSSIGRAVALLDGCAEDTKEGQAHLATAYENLVSYRTQLNQAAEDSSRPSILEAHEFAQRAHEELLSAISLVSDARENVATFRSVIAPGMGTPTSDQDAGTRGPTLRWAAATTDPADFGDQPAAARGQGRRSIRDRTDLLVKDVEGLQDFGGAGDKALDTFKALGTPPDPAAMKTHTGTPTQPGALELPTGGTSDAGSAIIISAVFALRGGIWAVDSLKERIFKHRKKGMGGAA